MAVSTDALSASSLTREQVSTILTRPLEAASTFLASGVQIFDTSGPLRIPRQPDYDQTDIAWVAENGLIGEADPDFDETSLMPSTMQSVKTITRYSNELARQSVVALDRVLRDRMVIEVAQKIDGQFYSAGGDGIATPQGMFAWTGTQPLPITGALTLDTVLTAQGLALAESVDQSRLRLFLRPADYMALRSQKDTTERYQLQPDAAAAAGPTVLGIPVVVSPRIPKGYAALADPTQIAVARDLAQSVTLLSERYAEYDQQAIRVVSRYDVAPLNPAAVVAITGIGSE